MFSFILLAGVLASIFISPLKVNANHAPVTPESYPSFNWQNPYGWYTNPNRPRRYPARRTDINTPATGPGLYEAFAVPDKNPMSWEEASRLCDREGGQLVWSRNRKVCSKRY